LITPKKKKKKSYLFYSFGQEQGNGAIAAISALSNLGQSGQAATLAGTSIQFLLAAANPCGKLTQADLIVSELGTSDAAIAAARGLVAAEQNFNPFVVSIPSICSDPTLPTTAALRGVVPLIDPAVVGEDIENANSNSSKITPFSADGLSVAQVMVAHGFSNFTAVDVAGNKVAASTLGTSASSSTSSNNTASANATSSAVEAAATSSGAAVACGGPSFVTVTRAVSLPIYAHTKAFLTRTGHFCCSSRNNISSRNCIDLYLIILLQWSRRNLHWLRQHPALHRPIRRFRSRHQRRDR
jgi:hypothetical protein